MNERVRQSQLVPEVQTSSGSLRAARTQRLYSDPPPGTMGALPSGAEADIGRWAQKPPHKCEILSADRIAALEDAGFSWRLPKGPRRTE